MKKPDLVLLALCLVLAIAAIASVYGAFFKPAAVVTHDPALDSLRQQIARMNTSLEAKVTRIDSTIAKRNAFAVPHTFHDTTLAGIQDELNRRLK